MRTEILDPYGIKIIDANPYYVANKLDHYKARVKGDFVVFPKWDFMPDVLIWLNVNNIACGNIIKISPKIYKQIT